MKKKILIGSKTFGKITPEPANILKDAGFEVDYNPYPDFFNEEQMLEVIQDYFGVVVGFDHLTEKVIAKAENLKVIAKHGVGVDTIDVDAATKHGVVVSKTVGANSSSVADFAIGLMLSTARQIPRMDAEVKQGEWPKYVGTELWKKTLGIIGLGHIGKAVAKRAAGFDMKLLAYEPYPDHDFVTRHHIELASVNRILEEADFITIHVPLSESTANMIGREELKKMKNTAFLVNTARGGIIDEDALYDALENNVIAGAAIDAFSEEPPGHTKLLNAKGMVATPHAAAYTNESLNRMSLMCADSICRVLHGEQPEFVVNPEVFSQK